MNPNEMKKLKEKAPFPLFLLLVLFFLPSLLIDPEIVGLQANTESYQSALKTARAAVKSRASLVAQNEKMQKLAGIKKDMFTVIPEESALPGLIDTLQQIAQRSAVSLEDVRYEFSREYEKLKVPAYKVHMNLKADYASMRSFLAEVENLDSPVIINEIVLTEGARYALTMRLLVK